MQEDLLSDARLAVTATAMDGDTGGLYQIVSGLLVEGVDFDSILFDLLIPVEDDIGARWASGEYLVSEEHAATAAIETVIALLAGSFGRPEDGMTVVVATAEGDDHSLPGRAVTANLISLGYRTTFLGANVLSSDLREYLELEQPQALVLSCAMPGHLTGARSGIRESHQAGVPVLVGGRGFGGEGQWVSAVGADAWVSRLEDVPEVLAKWEPDIDRSEAGAAVPDDDLTALIGSRARLVGDAEDRFSRMTGNSSGARLSDELSILLGAVEASLLVGDEALLTEQMRWQNATLSRYGLDEGAPLAASLIDALDGVSASAADMLRRVDASS